ncbi:AMP-binding enzyme [Bradyrhizobium japonicum]
MPDAYAGEVPVLFVVPSPGETIDLAQLREHLEHNVNEPPARPKRVVLLEALPATAVGKIFKPALRDLAVRERSGPRSIASSARHGGRYPRQEDEKLNTVVSISVHSGDLDRTKMLVESLATLPQTYRIENRSS